MKQEKQSETTKLLSKKALGYVLFLEEAATYFLNRPTNGEDIAHWANIYNAENCTKIAQYIRNVSDSYE